MEMVNGYVFLDLTKSNVYAKALKVLGADKPVVIKDGSNAPYFVDSLTLDGTNVVITKGGKTITIASDNTFTNVGDIQNHLYKCYATSVYLQTTGADYRGTFIITINEIPTNPNYYTFNDIKTYLSNLLDKCGIITIVPSDEDTTFKGTIVKDAGNKIFIEGYLDNDGYKFIDFDTLENDDSLELIFDWTPTKLF